MQGASFDYERTTDGKLSYVRIVGTIDERFDGKQAASRVKSKTVVVNCAGVTLVTSFGIRAWIDFVQSFARSKTALVMVECSPSFVGELNQVVDFAGDGSVVSFYAPYQCTSCSAERSFLLRTDTDQEVIRKREPPQFSCLVCGGSMVFDEEPVSYFAGLDAHIDPPLDPSVLGFLEARLGYETMAHRQLEIMKDVSGPATVLLFSGTLDGTLNGPKQAHGLQGDVAVDLTSVLYVQPQGLRAWREFLEHASQRAGRIWLIGCPALVVERALDGAIHTPIEVVSVRVPYHCSSCDGTEFHMVDMLGKDGQALRRGRLRDRTCSGCKSTSRALVGARVVERLRSLPEPALPKAVGRAARSAAKKTVRPQPKVDKAQRRLPSWLPALSVLAAAIAIAIVAVVVLRSNQEKLIADPAVLETPTTPAFERPEWIVSDAPNGSYCVDLGWQLQCVGVSSYQQSVELAAAEAFEAAIEVFAHTALLNAKSSALETQRGSYLSARSEAMARLEQAHQSGNEDDKTAAHAALWSGRRAVAAMMSAQAAPGAPTRRSDYYWEEYKAGSGTEFLAFVRIDSSSAEVKAFGAHYSATLRAGGARLTRLNPLMAWLFDAEGKVGFFVQSINNAGALVKRGLEPHDVLVADAGKDLQTLITEPALVVRRGIRYATTESLARLDQ